MRQARLGTEHRPEREGDGGDAQHREHEDGRDPVGELLDRRPAALRRGHHGHDPRQERFPTDLLGANDERAGAVDGRAHDLRARRLFDRQRLARDHRLVDRASAVENQAVHRNLLTRPDPQAVADVDLAERHVLLAAVGADPPGAGRRQSEELAQRRAGFAARLELEHLAEATPGW